MQEGDVVSGEYGGGGGGCDKREGIGKDELPNKVLWLGIEEVYLVLP